MTQTKQIGIRVSLEGKDLATLWQHLDADEVEAVIADEGIFALSNWSGTWEPSEPELDGGCEYEIITRPEPIDHCPANCMGCHGESHPCAECGYCSKQCRCHAS